MIAEISKRRSGKKDNLTIEKRYLDISSIFLIDSEILRSPLGANYGHAQDQQVKEEFWRAIEKNKKPSNSRLYGFIDYDLLPKNRMFSLSQAKYSCGFFLNMFPSLTGCFLFCGGDNNQIFLYSRGSERLKQEYNDFCFIDQLQSALKLEGKDTPKSRSIGYLEDFAEEVYLVSDRAEDRVLACDCSFCYLSPSYWLEAYF